MIFFCFFSDFTMIFLIVFILLESVFAPISEEKLLAESQMREYFDFQGENIMTLQTYHIKPTHSEYRVFIHVNCTISGSTKKVQVPK